MDDDLDRLGGPLVAIDSRTNRVRLSPMRTYFWGTLRARPRCGLRSTRVRSGDWAPQIRQRQTRRASWPATRRSASLARTFTQTARPALMARRFCSGDQRRRGPRQPFRGTREVWPRGVYCSLSGVRKARRRMGPRVSATAADAAAMHPSERSGKPVQRARREASPAVAAAVPFRRERWP